jgi:SAM-dependent methyltransferase
MIATAAAWEQIWAPYDAATYAFALNQITCQDVVYDIGAGDLRLARRMADVARRVYAVEINPEILLQGKRRYAPLPDNLEIRCADARTMDIPNGITVGVLLMRHCTAFSLYASKLRQAGCRRLVTNARWRMGVEVIELDHPPILYERAEMGWYACRCGAVGFKVGSAEQYVAESDAITQEVYACPACENPNLQGVDEWLNPK